MIEKKSELVNRVIFTILMILIYRFGTFIPVPGINSDVVKKMFQTDLASIFGMVNLFSGGALQRMSIFALNIMPYITASIVMQLLTSMNKGLESLKKEGSQGRSRINQYTKYLTIILAIFQSFGVYYALSNSDNSAFVSDSKIYLLTTVVSLVGGTVMLMWFGDRITSAGIGNGISVIIFVGIASSLPSSFIQIFDLSRTGGYSFLSILMVFAMFVGILLLICFIENSYKKIKIQYPSSATMRSMKMQDSSFLPLKINMSGVIPPIFASSFLMIPSALSQLLESEYGGAISTLFARGSFAYMFIFGILIMFFCYFYSSIIFNTEEVAENLKKSNCFIVGIRPGSNTASYLDKIVVRLTFLGSIYLVVICVVPEIIVTQYSVPLTIGGTGILIMVNVVLDVMNQFRSYLYSDKYSSVQKGRRVRLRVR